MKLKDCDINMYKFSYLVHEMLFIIIKSVTFDRKTISGDNINDKEKLGDFFKRGPLKLKVVIHLYKQIKHIYSKYFTRDFF